MSIANGWLLAAFAAAMSLNDLLGYLLYLRSDRPFFCCLAHSRPAEPASLPSRREPAASPSLVAAFLLLISGSPCPSVSACDQAPILPLRSAIRWTSDLFELRAVQQHHAAPAISDRTRSFKLGHQSADSGAPGPQHQREILVR